MELYQGYSMHDAMSHSPQAKLDNFYVTQRIANQSAHPSSAPMTFMTAFCQKATGEERENGTLFELAGSVRSYTPRELNPDEMMESIGDLRANAIGFGVIQKLPPHLTHLRNQAYFAAFDPDRPVCNGIYIRMRPERPWYLYITPTPLQTDINDFISSKFLTVGCYTTNAPFTVSHFFHQFFQHILQNRDTQSFAYHTHIINWVFSFLLRKDLYHDIIRLMEEGEFFPLEKLTNSYQIVETERGVDRKFASTLSATMDHERITENYTQGLWNLVLDSRNRDQRRSVYTDELNKHLYCVSNPTTLYVAQHHDPKCGTPGIKITGKGKDARITSTPNLGYAAVCHIRFDKFELASVHQEVSLLVSMAVAPSHQRKGIGSSLFNLCRERHPELPFVGYCPLLKEYAPFFQMVKKHGPLWIRPADNGGLPIAYQGGRAVNTPNTPFISSSEENYHSTVDRLNAEKKLEELTQKSSGNSLTTATSKELVEFCFRGSQQRSYRSKVQELDEDRFRD